MDFQSTLLQKQWTILATLIEEGLSEQCIGRHSISVRAKSLKVHAEIILELRKREEEFEEVNKTTTDCQASTQCVLLFEQKQNHHKPSFKLLKQNQSARAGLFFALDKRNQRQRKVSLHLLKQNQRQRKASYHLLK